MAALAQAISCESTNELAVAEKTKEAIARADGVTMIAPLLSSSDSSARLNALRVIHGLSDSPQLVPSLIDAGVVTPPALNILSQQGASDELLEMTAKTINNIAVTSKSVRAVVHGAGGLAKAVELLQSRRMNLQYEACRLVDTFSKDIEAQVILRDANAVGGRDAPA